LIIRFPVVLFSVVYVLGICIGARGPERNYLELHVTSWKWSCPCANRTTRNWK